MFKVMRSYELGKGINMDNYVGDLTDIFRASGGTGGSQQGPSGEWPRAPATANMNSNSSSSSATGDNFGDPFSVMMNDPLLLNGLEIPNSVFFSGSGLVGADGEVFVPQQAPPNLYTMMLEMCSSGDLAAKKNNTVVSVSTCDDRPSTTMMQEIKLNPAVAAGLVHRGDVSIRVDKSKGYLVEKTAGMMQISSPSNSGIKRRKSQAKKVVCIPAPATANSRATGEVVPSDLWAWRKYGQKPIKGSPYPRGYYRCSSSKGCSARKQVERSRTDPNMLEITYTSEHNHPWPTQRNALAGSTRTQPSSSKTINNVASNSRSASQSPLMSQKSPTGFKEQNEVDASSPTTLNAAGSCSTTSASVKEEVEDAEKEPEMEMEMEMEMEGGHDEFGEEFSHSYRPLKPEETNRADDFFADLGEITGDDPLGLLFSQGFAADGQKEGNKWSDPFSIFDWSIDEQNSAFGEAKRDTNTNTTKRP